MRNVVVLPQPDGPSRHTNSPEEKVTDRLSTAREFLPKYLVIEFNLISYIFNLLTQ
jgi:hypothetical protein